MSKTVSNGDSYTVSAGQSGSGIIVGSYGQLQVNSGAIVSNTIIQYGGSETVGGNAVVGSQDTRASVYGIVAGADYKVSPDTLLGYALAGGATGNSQANGLGSGSADQFPAGT